MEIGLSQDEISELLKIFYDYRLKLNAFLNKIKKNGEDLTEGQARIEFLLNEAERAHLFFSKYVGLKTK